MARPIKAGTDYFPLDVHMDDSIKLIEAEFGLVGFAVVVKLWQRIYSERGYYCEWNDEVALLFAKEVGAGSNAVSEIVNASVKRGIFSEELFNRYGILTSTGIQNRYFEITSRRAKVNVDERYLLVSAPQNAVCVTETGVYVYKNKGLCMQKSHKVKESKEKESKENKNSCNDDAVAEILWQYENLTGKTVTGSMASDVESFIADGIEKKLILAIIDYAVDSDIRKWNYIRATLNNLSAEGVTTMAEYKKTRAAWQSRKEGLSFGPTGKVSPESNGGKPVYGTVL